MNLDELVGAQLAVGFHGTEAEPGLIEALRRTHAQSLVVFSRNFTPPPLQGAPPVKVGGFTSAQQFTRLIRGLEAALGHRLLVMVDHEGGRVIRFSEGVTRFPDPLSVGRRHDPAAIERQGTVEADELQRLGVSVNLAPCVDVLAEGCDPIIGDRSYGSDPQRVSTLSMARIKGLQSHGVAACAKHFPGLGAVPRDPHKVLPTIGLDWKAMEAVHLMPFRAAVGAEVATIMSSHVCYPGLGEPEGLPATFSPRLIRDLLRGRLGYRGVILTDDLEMGALRTFGTIGEAAVRAVAAGHDVALICSDVSAAEEAFARLRRAYQDGRLDAQGLQASASRVDRLRKKFLCGALPP